LTMHPEDVTPRNQPTIGTSLTFVRDDIPRCLFAPLKRQRQWQRQPLAHICRCAQPARAVHFYAMHDLFAKSEAENLERVSAAAPLAARMRPRTLDEFVGQEHILALGKLLRRAIKADRLLCLLISG